MKYLITGFLLLCIYYSPSFAQIGIYYNDRYAVVVSDSSNNALIGANIMLTCKGDTIRGVAKKNLSYSSINAMYVSDKVFGDSVTVEVSYVGYKTFKKRYANNQLYYLRVILTEDEQSIGQIVVMGSNIAMIIRGDTTIFNASSFKTMQGDRFSELIKQLPGVEIKDNKIYANGEIIKRVYVDGKHMFGLNSEFSLTDLKAADVKNVKIYDEPTAMAKRTGDKSIPKEKVIDVVTHNKPTAIKGGELSALGGMSLDKDFSDRREIRHSESGRLHRNSEAGNIRLEASNIKDAGEGGHTSSDSKITPVKTTNGYLLYAYRRGDSTSISTNVGLNRNKSSQYQTVMTDYFSTADYKSRVSNSSSNTVGEAYGFNATNSVMLIRRKNNFMSNLNVGLSKNDNRSRTITSQDIDGNKTNTDQLNSSKNTHGNANAMLAFSKYVSTKISFGLQASLDYENSSMKGWNVDTLASNAGLRVFLNNDNQGAGIGVSGSASVQWKINDTERLGLAYNINRRNQKSQQISMDYLDPAALMMDSVNSYDYTVNSLWNTLSANWGYFTDNVMLSANLSGTIYQVNRDDRFPLYDDTPKRFYQINPSLTFMLRRPKHNLSASLSMQSGELSVEMLRNTLNVDNPQFLTVGNPDLKPTSTTNANLSYTLQNAEKARSLSFSLSGGYTFNFLATRRTFFKEATYLPQYNYTAQQSAQLSSYENVDGYYNSHASVFYSQRVAAVKSTVRAGVQYSFVNSPYYVDDALSQSQQHSMSLILAFMSGFSSKLMINVTSATSMGYLTAASDNSRYLNERVNAMARVDIASKYNITVKGQYSMYRNGKYKSSNYDIVMADAEAGRRFGKENNLSVSIGVVDIFNRSNYLLTQPNIDYMSTTNTSYLGRYGYVKAVFQF